MPRFAEWNYGPQNRLLAALEWHNWKETFLFDRLDMVLSTQRIEESRITRFFGADDRNTEAEQVRVYALSVDLEKQLDPSREMILKYGLEGILNDLSSEAYRMSLSSGQRFNDIFTRYPSKSAGTTQLGVYATFATKATQSDLRFESGVRYSYVWTRAEYARSNEIAWPESYLNGLSSDNHALTGSAALQLPYTKFLRQRFSIGTAFRAPNIDDMAKIRTKGPEAQIPNFDLKPENTWQAESTLEATIERSRTRLRAAATVFYTRLKNAIIQSPFSLPDGSNTLFIGGMPFSTFSNINAENAYITGAGLALEGKGRHWGANLRIQYTYGRTELEDREQPLAHIPPVYGMLSFWYEVPIFKWRISIPAHGAKKLEDYAPDSSDNLEYATPDGTPAWYTINLYTEVTISENLSAYLSVENILDRYYRPFSSGISAPGRHLSVTLMGKF
jgi:hemoglobin/transferrin/lactoferrin receptor protein